MTPEAARKCWCPLARGPSGHGVVWNQPGSPGSGQMRMGDANCIADACMAWRWIVSPRRIEEAKRNVKLLAPGSVTSPERALVACEPSGYCGVAGSHGLD